MNHTLLFLLLPCFVSAQFNKSKPIERYFFVGYWYSTSATKEHINGEVYETGNGSMNIEASGMPTYKKLEKAITDNVREVHKIDVKRITIISIYEFKSKTEYDAWNP